MKHQFKCLLCDIVFICSLPYDVAWMLRIPKCPRCGLSTSVVYNIEHHTLDVEA